MWIENESGGLFDITNGKCLERATEESGRHIAQMIMLTNEGIKTLIVRRFRTEIELDLFMERTKKELIKLGLFLDC